MCVLYGRVLFSQPFILIKNALIVWHPVGTNVVQSHHKGELYTFLLTCPLALLLKERRRRKKLDLLLSHYFFSFLVVKFYLGIQNEGRVVLLANLRWSEVFLKVAYPLLISTGFLKYPLELKKISVRTEKKFQLVYTDFFFSSNWFFFSFLTFYPSLK